MYARGEGKQGSKKVRGQFEGFAEFSQSEGVIVAFQEMVGRPGIQLSGGFESKERGREKDGLGRTEWVQILEALSARLRFCQKVHGNASLRFCQKVHGGESWKASEEGGDRGSAGCGEGALLAAMD